MTEMLERLAPAFIGLLGTVLGAAIVVVGWFKSHKLTMQREIEAKRREQHLNYLVQTYRTLSKVKPYDQLGNLSKLNGDLQQALADIQFLGSSEQVAYARAFAEQFRKGSYDLDPLLKSIRDDLRQALGKGKIEDNIWWITIADTENPLVTEYKRPDNIILSK